MGKSLRVHLNAISGARFFSMLLLVTGHMTESLWIDSGGEAVWLSVFACSWMKRAAKDMVCFYFILAGFVMTWGYLNRDITSWTARVTFWKRRLARFYPHYFISSVLCLILKEPTVVGCHVMTGLAGGAYYIYNILAFFLVTCWFMVIGSYANGPSWFIVTLFWLWVFFPIILRPVKLLFKDDSSHTFLLKMVILWILSLAPFVLIIVIPLTSPEIAMHQERIRWQIRAMPIFRLAEFVMGMGLALRLNDVGMYTSIDTDTETLFAHSKAERGVGILPVCALALMLAYYFVMVSFWDPKCPCLAGIAGCYGYAEVFDTKFAPLIASIIYGVAHLDAHAARYGATSQNFHDSVGAVGSYTHAFLTQPVFVEVGEWGLQIFLYQTVASIMFEALAVDVHWMSTRCSSQHLSHLFQVFYVVAKTALTYLISWLMQDKGLIGGPIYRAVGKWVD